MTTIGEISSGDYLLLENSSSSSSSSEIASNADILIQILLRLPVKSLLAFKSVSKLWLSIISDPHFVHNHCLQYHPSIPGFFLSKLRYLDIDPPEFEFILLDGNLFGSGSVPAFKILNDPEDIDIIQSCNGLLCCVSGVRWGTDNSLATLITYYVYNPSTMHDKILLPPSQFREHPFSNFDCSVSLVFDPLKSPHYEAVFIWSKDGENYQFEIYSSKTDSWRLSGDAFSVVNAASDIFSTSGVYWNGSLHWIGVTGPSVYFDMDRELIMTMPMPPLPDGWDWRKVTYFGAYKGHMHLIEMYPDNMKGHIDILEMETDHRGWNLKYRLDLNNFITVSHPEINWDDIGISNFLKGSGFSILKFFDEEEEEEESSKLVIQMPHYKVFCYDLMELSLTKIHELVPFDYSSEVLYEWCDAHLYIPTLALV